MSTIGGDTIIPNDFNEDHRSLQTDIVTINNGGIRNMAPTLADSEFLGYQVNDIQNFNTIDVNGKGKGVFMDSKDEVICRICLSEEEPGNPIISPCNCTGSV
jgi:hypothetical protein